MPAALDKLVKKLMSKGMDKSKAYAVATASLQKSSKMKKSKKKKNGSKKKL